MSGPNTSKESGRRLNMAAFGRSPNRIQNAVGPHDAYFAKLNFRIDACMAAHCTRCRPCCIGTSQPSVVLSKRKYKSEITRLSCFENISSRAPYCRPNQLKLYITSALIHVSGLSELIRTSKGKHKQASKSKQARASTSKQAKANKGKQAKASKGFDWLYQHKIRK